MPRRNLSLLTHKGGSAVQHGIGQLHSDSPKLFENRSGGHYLTSTLREQNQSHGPPNGNFQRSRRVRICLSDVLSTGTVRALYPKQDSRHRCRKLREQVPWQRMLQPPRDRHGLLPPVLHVARRPEKPERSVRVE